MSGDKLKKTENDNNANIISSTESSRKFSPKSNKTLSSDSITHLVITKNICRKNILIIFISGLIFGMVLSLVLDIIRKYIITFDFTGSYVPFQTNEITLLLIVVIKICKLLNIY